MTKTAAERAAELCGLIYKYRRDWKESLRYNRLAAELQGDDEATNWNLGIAATALKEWRLARAAWRRAGITVEDSDDPIDENFGYTPVRLNGFESNGGDVEVVWAHRRSPVTARISNIPTPAARFRYGDVVLHDGAATGTRLYEPGDERPVFNAFELFEPSDFITFDTRLIVPDEAALQALTSSFEEARIEMEDWTESVTILCKACSEGAAHGQHDHGTTEEEWQQSRRVGFASRAAGPVEKLLNQWLSGGAGRAVESIES